MIAFPGLGRLRVHSRLASLLPGGYRRHQAAEVAAAHLSRPVRQQGARPVAEPPSADPEKQGKKEGPGLFKFWRRIAGGRQQEFWRWSAGIGWTLDLLLLTWVLFLRSTGLVDRGNERPGGDAASVLAGGGQAGYRKDQVDTKQYETLLQRGLQEERSISETNSKLEGVLTEMSANLGQLNTRVRALLRPEDDDPPRYEDAVLTGLIDELQARVDADRELLRSRDSQLLRELQGKPDVLRDLSTKLQQQKQREATAAPRGKAVVSVPPPSEQAAHTFNTEEMVQFVQGSVLPVASFLAASLLVTVLSQQFVRVATAWRRQQWSKAERARKIQLRRFQKFQRTASQAWNDLSKGKWEKASKDLREVMNFLSRWSAEPTWEELIRAEAAAFWERWGPQAFRLEATLPGIQEAPKAPGPQMTRWVAEKWFSSAQEVIKGYVMGALRAWAREQDEERPAAAQQPTGLVIRIFGRWPEPQENWVNIANLPLAGDWREKALRLLIPAEKDVQDLPLIGPLCESALTAVVSSQVSRVVSTSVWGSLTTDLWQRGPQRPFQIGYEVVEVPSQDKEVMCALARSLPAGGTPGRVVRVRPEIESRLGSMDRH